MTQPLDFERIDKLRRHMLLSTADMAEVFGVSRVTYFGWLKGKPVRKNNAVRVKEKIRCLMAIIVAHKWPSPDVLVMKQKDRVRLLFKLLETTQG